MNIEFRLELVSEKDKDVLYRLLQYSLFEESQTDLNEMNDEALFEYKWFDKYFEEEDREAYLIKEKDTDKILGFVMINTYVQKFDKGYSIAEFMIIPKYRRNKIGKRVAIECFNKHRGNWEVKPSYKSESAYNFWKNVVDEYTNKDNKFEDGIFLFINKEG